MIGTRVGSPEERADKPLRVVHLTSAETLSGGARQAILLAGGLSREGHRVVFCAPPGSQTFAQAGAVGLDAQPLTFGGLWGQWRASRRLREIVAGEGADLVHSHHTKGHNVAVLATLGGRFPPVVVKRGVLFRPVFPAKFRTRRVSAVIANTRAVRDVLVRNGVPAGKIHVVYNAKEVPDLAAVTARSGALRTEWGLDGAWPVVGTSGNARPEKGYQHLVEAAPAILERFPQAAFVLLGAGTQRLAPRIAELGLEDRFRLPGHRTDALDAMALFDLFVFPGVDMDSCANVLLEAMSLGLPVVGSDMPGMDEVIAEGQGTGRLFRAADPAALAAAATAVVQDREAARAMGRRALAKVRAEHDLAGRVRETLAVYRVVLAGRG